MALDCVIRGGTVVDGTGAERRRADVGIRAGRIACIEDRIDESAAECVDASDLVVAPGFIDSHTHLDGQLFWDPVGTSSSWHGCTTAISGNCGFTLAPLRDRDPDYPIGLMAGVEQIPRELLAEGVPFDWDSFAGYTASLERSGMGINLACYVGYPLIRYAAMGEDAFDPHSSEEQLREMERLAHEALSAGALGISINRQPGDRDDRGRTAAGCEASWQELRRVVATLSAHPGTLLQAVPGWLLPKADGRVGDEAEQAAWIEMLAGVDRTFVWGPMIETFSEDYLAFVERARGKGVRTVAATGVVPLSTIASFKLPNVFGTIPAWSSVFEKSEEERLRAFSDPAFRAKLREGTGEEGFVAYPLQTVDEQGNVIPGPEIPLAWSAIFRIGAAPMRLDLEGPSLHDEAVAAGVHPVDVLLDALVASRLEEFLLLAAFGRVPDRTLDAMQHRDTVLSRNDTGAHLTFLCNAESTQLLAQWVREREALSLERAVHLLTGRQAEVFELADRGTLATGKAADLVLFDAERVAPLAPELRHDLPGGGVRLAQRAEGIERVIVAGRTILRDGRATGETPGRFLRPAEMRTRSQAPVRSP